MAKIEISSLANPDPAVAANKLKTIMQPVKAPKLFSLVYYCPAADYGWHAHLVIYGTLIQQFVVGALLVKFYS
jgi:hypothetical protein